MTRMLMLLTLMLTSLLAYSQPSTDNKALYDRFLTAFNEGNLEVLTDLVAEDYRNHAQGVEPGLEGYLQLVNGFRAAFPDLQASNILLLAEGDFVAAYNVISGTNSGAFMGMPATGERIRVETVDTYRVENGRFVEHWEVTDSLALLRQLGVIPAQEDGDASSEVSASGSITRLVVTPTSVATLEANKEVMRDFVDAFNRQDYEAFDALVASDFVDHSEGVPPGLEAYKQYAVILHDALPDVINSIELLIADGDYVATYTTVRGTHSGAFFGIPPTGEAVSFSTMNLYRLENGKLAEHWAVVDQLSLLQQLGVIPSTQSQAPLEPTANAQTPAARGTTTPEAAPLALLPAETVYRFEPGDFVESIAVDAEGILYATIIRLEGTSEIWRILPDGRSGTFVTLAGVGTISVDAEGNLYATVANFDLENPEAAEPASLWRITPKGVTERLMTLPQGAQPNGSTLDKGGNLYVADSALGKIWLLRRGSSEIETWLEHDLLRPQGQPGFPGANGVKFFGGDLYASNSSTGSIVRIPVGADGAAGEPTVHATGVPTDDFAFDSLGNLYATTHPFDTVVRVKPDGSKETVATAEQGVIGPTAAVFGTQPGTTDSLYVVTDGGLFGSFIGMNDGTDLRPALVRLEVGLPGALQTSDRADADEALPELILAQRPGFSPEGIEYDADRQRFLLSSLAEGTIFAVTDDGTVTPFFIEDEALLATGGIHIDRERQRLLVTNVDSAAVNRFLTGEALTESIQASLAAYDLATGERLFLADLTQVAGVPHAIVNDVMVDEAGNAYVTNSAAPVIYKVTPQGDASIFVQDERLSAPQFGLNGIDYHPDGYLLAVVSGSASLCKIPLDNPQALNNVQLEQSFVGDGIALSPDGTLIAVGFVGDFTSPTPVVLELTSSDNWESATVLSRAETQEQASTATIRDNTVYVIYPHFFEPDPQSYEIVRVGF